MKSKLFVSYGANRRTVYAATRRIIKEHRTIGDRIFLFILICAAIVVDRKFGLSYALLGLPLALAYGLYAGFRIRKKMRT